MDDKILQNAALNRSELDERCMLAQLKSGNSYTLAKKNKSSWEQNVLHIQDSPDLLRIYICAQPGAFVPRIGARAGDGGRNGTSNPSRGGTWTS